MGGCASAARVSPPPRPSLAEKVRVVEIKDQKETPVSESANEDDDPCAICRGSTPDRRANIVVTACNHTFHFNCFLQQAVMYGGGERNHLRRCPVCRAELQLESARFEGRTPLGLPEASATSSRVPRTI